MNLDIIRQFNGLQINIQTNKWRTALVLFCKGKVIGFVPCSMCNQTMCKCTN